MAGEATALTRLAVVYQLSRLWARFARARRISNPPASYDQLVRIAAVLL